jgi:hypothetical protein
VKDVGVRADLQVWVCVNEREPGAQLASCGRARGELLLEELRRSLAPFLTSRGLSMWVNRTLCQGFCHASGVTLTLEPLGLKLQAVAPKDVPEVVARVKSAFGG